jgi:hypothetical protein
MRNGIRILILTGLALMAALLFSVGLNRILDEAGVKAPRTNLDVLWLFQSRLKKVEAVHGIAYLGDSTGMSGDGQKYSIPGRLNALLQQQPDMPPVVSLAEAGLGPMDFYLLAAELSKARPAAVVLSINLAALSHVWAQRLSHPEFASVIGGSRWLEAFGLPAVVNGVKADRLLLYPGLQASGLSGVWREINHYQARVLQGWRELGTRVGGHQGPWGRPLPAALQSGPSKEALFAEFLRQQQWGHYGKAIGGMGPEETSFQILRAALAHWKSMGVPVLMVVIPINVKFIQSLGIDDVGGRKRTLATLAEVAQDEGAQFLDIHDLLPEESFADWQGHYSLTPTPDGPSLIADKMAPALVSMIEQDQ